MSPNIGYDELRVDTVVGVAKLMAASAITAPKSGGQLFLAGKQNFMETVIVEDPDERHRIGEWLRASPRLLHYLRGYADSDTDG